MERTIGLIKNVLVIGIKAIETKNRHVTVSYIHGRLKKGIKLHMSTLNGPHLGSSS